MDVTATLQEAERIRFENGESDFFLVNMREINAANARVKNIMAEYEYMRAWADYYVATVDLEALEIPSQIY